MQKIKEYFIRNFRITQLTSLSLSAFSHYKKLWLIPIINTFLFAVLLTSSFIILYSLRYYAQTSWIFSVIAFWMIVFIPFFATFLFQFLTMVMVFLVDQYCQKGKASFFYALQKSINKIHLIAQWTAYSVLFRSKFQKKENSKTFFIYSVFAFENKTFFDSIKQSENIMKTYFGTVPREVFRFTALYLTTAISLLATLIFLYIFYTYFTNNITSRSLLFIATISFGTLIETSLTQIVASVILYRYVHNLPTGIISRTQIEEALNERI